VEAEKKSERIVFRLQLTAVIIGVLLLAAKFVAYFLTHSNTILSDALESIINVAAGGFALFSIYVSSKPVDYEHPYGHGKIEFLSAGLEGIMIIIAGAMIIGKSVWSFFTPAQLEHLDLGLVIIIVTGIINYALGFALVKVGEKHRSLTLKADGEHLKSDAYSSFGIFAGLILIVLTRVAMLDNIVAIVFGVIIIYMGVKLARKSVAGIMDEADSDAIDKIVEVLNQKRRPEWIDVHNLRLIQFGNKMHIDCHVTLPWYYTLRQSHVEIDEIARVINENSPGQVEFFIHGDPCIHQQCRICTLFECKVREVDFDDKIEWTPRNVRRNKRHGL
jgi:cation diffusion facilitator family transporter